MSTLANVEPLRPFGGGVHRGASNRNERGNTTDRRRRREWLVQTYRSNRDMMTVTKGPAGTYQMPIPSGLPERIWQTYLVSAEVPYATIEPTCRCYRCGDPLTVETVTPDRIVPGCKGGTYRRTNIRPACSGCNSETGGALASQPKPKRRQS